MLDVRKNQKKDTEYKMTENEIKKRIDDYFCNIKKVVAGRKASSGIILADYESEFDFYALCSDSSQSFEDFRIIHARTYDELKRRGYNVIIRSVKFGEYLNWLKCYGFDNTGENRAQYVARVASNQLEIPDDEL